MLTFVFCFFFPFPFLLVGALVFASVGGNWNRLLNLVFYWFIVPPHYHPPLLTWAFFCEKRIGWAFLLECKLFQCDAKGSSRGGDESAKRDAVGVLPGQNSQVCWVLVDSLFTEKLCSFPLTNQFFFFFLYYVIIPGLLVWICAAIHAAGIIDLH